MMVHPPQEINSLESSNSNNFHWVNRHLVVPGKELPNKEIPGKGI